MTFSNPPEPHSFNTLVWKIVKQIPAGRVSTYGQIAAMIPPPESIEPSDYNRTGARWVGKALNATPSGEGIPWQRVINSQGKISLPPGSTAATEQRTRLEAEGIHFDEKGGVDFDIVGWEGPSEDWLTANGLHPPPPLGKSGGGQMRLF